jgi:hypothetical protein
VNDPLVTLIAGHLVALDTSVRRSSFGFLAPTWKTEQIDTAARAVATVLRTAVDEVMTPFLDEVERVVAEDREEAA